MFTLKTKSKVPILLAAVKHVTDKLKFALAIYREYDRLYDKQPTIMVLPVPKKYVRPKKKVPTTPNKSGSGWTDYPT